MKIYGSIDEIIGKTPLLRLHGIEKHFGVKAKLYAKLEIVNPTGSVKDRAALNMILDAEKKGILKEGSVIIEPTSGNTGIGLAAIGAVRGYRVIIVMPDTMSIERIKLMKAYGAEVVLSDGSLGMKGAIDKANELAASIEGSFIPDQFSNLANAEAHFLTTGPEIWDDTDGNVDAFVAGIGSGGTVTGTGKYLKSKNPRIAIVGAEPKSSPFITEGVAGAHKIQGIGAGFIPKNLDVSVLDEVITVSDDDAISTGALLPKADGVLAGVSSGAAVWAAVSYGKRPENEGKSIVVLIADTGARYLSGEMFS